MYEILLMGAVSITIHSSLDISYSQFPIVLVDSWAQVFEPGALSRYRRDILNRYPEIDRGVHFFANTHPNLTYKDKLEATYWTQLIDAEKTGGHTMFARILFFSASIS